MSRATLLAAFSMVLCLVAATAPAAAQMRVEAQTLAGLKFTPPDGAEVTLTPLDKGIEVVAVTRGDEVCLITVYHNKRLPVTKALAVHVEELTRELRETAVKDSVAVKTFRQRLFRRWRVGKRIDFKLPATSTQPQRKMQAHVIAGVARGRTVVVSWSAPRKGISRAFSPALITSLTPLKRTKKGK